MDAAEFRSVTDLLAGCGLVITHPVLGCGVLLDFEGKQVSLSPEYIHDLVGLAVGPLLVQFWLDADTDISCYVRYVAPGTQVLTFSWVALDQGERERVEVALQRMVQQGMDSTVAVLVEHGEDLTDGECDALVLYDRLPPRRPRRVQFRTDRLDALPAVLAQTRVTDLGNGLSDVHW